MEYLTSKKIIVGKRDQKEMQNIKGKAAQKTEDRKEKSIVNTEEIMSGKEEPFSIMKNRDMRTTEITTPEIIMIEEDHEKNVKRTKSK